MTENLITDIGMHSLTIVRKERKKRTRAKLVNIQAPPSIRRVSLPPVQEGYIKVKKYDFL